MGGTIIFLTFTSVRPVMHFLLKRPIKFIAVLSTLVFMSCNLDYFNQDRFAIESYPATYALPVMKGSLTLEDLLSADTLDNSEFQESNGLLMMRAADTTTIVGNDLFWIVDRTNALSYEFNSSMISSFESSGQYNIKQQCDLGFYGVNKPTIINGEIASGVLQVSITTNLNHEGTVRVSAPYFTFNGDTADLIVAIEPSGNTKKTVTRKLSLAGSTWTFPEFGSKILTYSELSLTNSGNSTNVGDFIKIEISMVDIVYENLVGQLANQRAERYARVPLGFMKHLNGEIEFSDPRVNVYMSSSFGTIMSAEIQELYSFKKGAEIYKREFGGTPKNGIKLFEPTPSGYDYNTLNLAFTNATAEFIGGAGGTPAGADPNKVMSYVFENSPDSLRAKYFVRSNPNWDPEIGEFYDGSEFRVITEVLLPFEGAAELYMLDTFDYNFLSENDAESIDYVILKLIVGNSLPVEAEIAIDVYDQHPWDGSLSKLFALKSTKGNIKLDAAEVDADGQSVGLKAQTIEIRLEREQVKMLARGDKMIVTSDISTPRNESVILSANNELQLQLGIKVKAGIPVDELN